MQKQRDWNNVKNILCVRPDNIGDVIMTIPAIKALKHHVKGRKITLLASGAGAGIASFIPEIDDVITFDTPWVKNNGASSGEEVMRLIEKIKEKNFDGAVLFSVYSQNPLPSAMICYLAGIPKVAGYCRENPYQLITDWLPDREPIYHIRHEVERQLELTGFLGCSCSSDSFSLSVNDSLFLSVDEMLEKFGLNSSTGFVVMHPGVSEQKRQFPINDFSEAARLIYTTTGLPVVITGMESEKHLATTVINSIGEGVVDLTGRLTLGELIALLKRSRLLISNNTGPVHIAAAVGTPVVVLYALTNPQHTPWKVKHRVLPFDVPENIRSKNVVIEFAYEKSFRSKPKKISPKDIFNAAQELLKNSSELITTTVLKL